MYILSDSERQHCLSYVYVNTKHTRTDPRTRANGKRRQPYRNAHNHAERKLEDHFSYTTSVTPRLKICVTLRSSVSHQPFESIFGTFKTVHFAPGVCPTNTYRIYDWKLRREINLMTNKGFRLTKHYFLQHARNITKKKKNTYLNHSWSKYRHYRL